MALSKADLRLLYGRSSTEDTEERDKIIFLIITPKSCFWGGRPSPFLGAFPLVALSRNGGWGPMKSKLNTSLYARDVNWPRPLCGFSVFGFVWVLSWEIEMAKSEKRKPKTEW